jgi:hypothetical protein
LWLPPIVAGVYLELQLVCAIGVAAADAGSVVAAETNSSTAILRIFGSLSLSVPGTVLDFGRFEVAPG